MGAPRNATLGEYIFNKIDSNEYLQEIYETILYNYSMKLIHEEHRNRPINRDHALRFADILSKSGNERHKTWAQEIVALLNALFPTDTKVRAYATSVLATIGNYRGLELIKSRYKSTSFLDDLYQSFDKEYLSIPHQEDMYFFHSQKKIYDHLGDRAFSYSGPTSLGKSLMMRMFIKDKILGGYKGNFAILVPTKALITEISSAITHEDLKEGLASSGYKMVTSGNSIFLKSHDAHFIMVLTPERLLYLLMSYPDISIDYLFIDEAHKINEKDGRSAFYYKVTDMLAQRARRPHIILASPNIPNPGEFFNALPEEQREGGGSFSTSFTPVSQMKYIIDLVKGDFSIYNERCGKRNPFVQIESIVPGTSYFSMIKQIIDLDPSKSNIVYCAGKDRTITLARQYANTLAPISNPDLEKLAKEIKEEIHDDYFLAELVEKGVAYHVGYLPMSIRTAIEEGYRKGLIKTIFCTSTLIEGVNLPADNLFAVSYMKGSSKMTPVEFRNLLGRVGRIKYNLYGNVFIIRHSTRQSEQTIKEMLQGEVPSQKISLTAGLGEQQKRHIVERLLEGRTDFAREAAPDDNSYDLMRKVGLILAKDITKGRKSVVRKEFETLLCGERENTIRKHFVGPEEDKPVPDDDINVSLDQTANLIAAIKDGKKYPELVDGRVRYEDLLSFLKDLSAIFRWDIYEPKSLGNGGSISYYASLLARWMNGTGLKQILNQIIDFTRQNLGSVYHNGSTVPFNNSPEHKNILIGNTLSDIENVILFSIANYFLRFSTEYKRLKTSGQPFENDWYEYVEFGSTNDLTIFLQRCGLSRDTADYIREHRDKFVIRDRPYKLRRSILQCGKESVEKEMIDVQYNIPEIFE